MSFLEVLENGKGPGGKLFEFARFQGALPEAPCSLPQPIQPMLERFSKEEPR
jgi:hypothetical protein